MGLWCAKTEAIVRKPASQAPSHVYCVMQAIKFALILDSAVLPLSAYRGLLAAARPAAGAQPTLPVPQRLEGAACRKLLQLLAVAAGLGGAQQAPAPAPSQLPAADINAPAKVCTVCGGAAVPPETACVCCLWRMRLRRPCRRRSHLAHPASSVVAGGQAASGEGRCTSV